MEMVEQMVFTMAKEVLGSATVEFEGTTIDLTPPWPRLDLREEIKRRSGIDFLEANDIETLKSEMAAIGLDVGHQMSWGGLLDKLLSDTVEPHIVQPSFLVDYPVEMSPLAKKKRNDSPPRGAVRGFHRRYGGMQLLHRAETTPSTSANAWSNRNNSAAGSRTRTPTASTRSSSLPSSTGCRPQEGWALGSTA